MPAPPKSIFSKFRRSLLYLAVVFAVCVGGYHIYGWNFVDSIYMVVILSLIHISDSHKI